MPIQARLPPALCALHNFIRIQDPTEIFHFNGDDIDPEPIQFGNLGEGPANQEERSQAKDLRDEIATRMWEDYQRELRERGELA